MASKSTNAKDEKAEQKTAGTDESKDVQTTKQAEERKDEVPTKAEGLEESDPEGAATGSVAGGVRRGDTGLEDDDFEDEVVGDEFEGALGTVREANAHRESFDVPYTILTPQHFSEESKVRTSDSDDGRVVAWNAQWANEERDETDGEAEALVPVQAVPGQTFRRDELPNVDVMRAAGIDPVQYLSGLPVRPDVPDEGHRRGIPA